jgi:hypothetical protein
MEEIFYNILWIDDEHETLSGTKGRAKRNGINLIPFKSLNGGLSELERNYPFYDGVLLDAKFFEYENDVKGSEDDFNVHRAKERLLQIKKKFEIYVLTGQTDVLEDRTFKKAFTKVYKKGSDDEIDRLFKDIKYSAAMQEDTQLRKSYNRVFDVCTENYIGEYAGQDLLNLLKVNDETNIDSHFNTIRKIIEDLFTAFSKFRLLPIEFTTPVVALNESSKFLAGKGSDGSLFTEKGYQHLEGTHLPSQIVYYLRSILTITQAGSHRSSVFFQLLDVLVWFKMYVDSNPKKENWIIVEENAESNPLETVELIPGKVINVNTMKGFAFFKPEVEGDNIFIPPHLVSSKLLQEEQPIRVEVQEYTDNRTGEIKLRVKRIEIV